METLKAGKLARLALELTGTLIKTHGPRPSGGKSALSAAEDLKQAYQSFCDEARCDDEHFHTQAIHIPLKLMPILYPVLLALLWCGLPLTATIIAVLFLRFPILNRSFTNRYWKDGQNRLTERTSGRPSVLKGGKTYRHFLGASRQRSDFHIFQGGEVGICKERIASRGAFLLLVVESAVQLLTEILPENFWVSACLR